MDLTSNGPAPTHIFPFPILRSGEIIQCLSELNAEFTQDELAEPIRHKDKLRTVWIRLIEACAGKNEEALKAPEILKEQAENSPSASLHEDFADIFFFRALRSLLVAAGYDTFGLKDLHAPSPKRLRVQLSALINFAKFQQEEIDFLAELNETRKVCLDALEELNNENADRHEKLVKAEASAKQNNAEMEALTKECQELTQEIAKYNKLQTASRLEGEKMKRRANDLKDELAAAVWQLQEEEAEEEQLRGQIVSSPDRRKEEVKMSREDLDKIKAKVVELEDSTQRGKKSCRNLKQALKDVSTCIGNLDELQQVCDQNADVGRKVESALHDVTAKKQQKEKLLEESQEAERDVGRAEEKIESQHNQHRLQIEALEEALQSAKSQLLQVEKERREGMVRVKDWERQVKDLEEAFERQKAETNQQTEEMIAEYKVLEDEFLAHDRKQWESLEGSSVSLQ